MSDYNEATKNMIPFFEKLSIDIKENNLTPKQLQIAGQLYMMWDFENNSDMEAMSEEDVKKYLFTGWYVHKNIDSFSGPG